MYCIAIINDTMSDTQSDLQPLRGKSGLFGNILPVGTIPLVDNDFHILLCVPI